MVDDSTRRELDSELRNAKLFSEISQQMLVHGDTRTVKLCYIILLIFTHSTPMVTEQIQTQSYSGVAYYDDARWGETCR